MITTRFSLAKAFGSLAISAPTFVSGATATSVTCPGSFRIVSSMNSIASG